MIPLSTYNQLRISPDYGPFLYKSLGFGTVQQLLIQCGYITICPFGNLFNSLASAKPFSFLTRQEADMDRWWTKLVESPCLVCHSSHEIKTFSSPYWPVIGCAGTVSALVGECVTVSRFNETGDRGTAAAAVFFLFLHIVL